MDARADSSLRRWLARFGWLVVFWMAGVVAVGLVAWLVRAVMHHVGLASA